MWFFYIVRLLGEFDRFAFILFSYLLGLRKLGGFGEQFGLVDLGKQIVQHRGAFPEKKKSHAEKNFLCIYLYGTVGVVSEFGGFGKHEDLFDRKRSDEAVCDFEHLRGR